MGRFFIDKQPNGWRWYAYGGDGIGTAITDKREGFKTRKAALEDAQGFFA